MRILITGGAGFIGSNFIRYWLNKYPDDEIVNLDKITYAGHLSSTKDFSSNPKYTFIKGDICNQKTVEKSIEGVDIVIHFAAESHVDRSIVGPKVFLETNVLGTQVMLEAALKAKVKLFHHVSTDEVFGTLELSGHDKFNEKTPYDPNSPYSASKASSDHLVRAYYRTYGLPVTITNTSNNFGPYQDPEKLIPRFIINLLQGKKVPLMGKGENVRDWLYVIDHARAIDMIVHAALEDEEIIGETFCIGGNSERSNLEITKSLIRFTNCDDSFIEYVEHRLGHDERYAIDSSKIEKVLGWKPEFNFEDYLIKTVDWYKENEWWWKPLLAEKREVVDRVSQKSYKD
jgi:dTDP-glucose 4,6-dehydratase